MRQVIRNEVDQSNIRLILEQGRLVPEWGRDVPEYRMYRYQSEQWGAYAALNEAIKLEDYEASYMEAL